MFGAAAAKEEWAIRIVAEAARSLATALVDLQCLIDPEGAAVLGGGIGLLPGFRAAVDEWLHETPLEHRPELRTAELGLMPY